MIPSGFIQDLLTRVDIVDVVGRHVELKKAGINHKGLCPFHGEKTPSFIVSPSRQTYHCFGCGVHGDAVRFLTDFVGMGFVEAVQDLAQQVGMQVPDDDRSPEEKALQAQRKDKAHTLSETMATAAAHYRQQLKASDRAKDYLKGRGLTGEIARHFGIGYAPDGWRSLSTVFPKYDDPLLEECGLVIVQDGEGGEAKRYDRFRDRVMFPIRSVQGEVIGFGGRVIGQGEPKYLNSPETPVFIKGRELYGLYEARTAIRQAGYVLVVEGYMDVVALAQQGLGHAVATLGTACTEDHVRKLFRFTESVVFSFDGDAAGRKAAARALEACLPLATDTRSIRFLFLPAEHDPDSFVREHGQEAFKNEVEQAVPLSRQLIALAQQQCDMTTPEGRARFASQAQGLWKALPEGALQRQMLGEIARTAALGEDDLARLWKLGGGSAQPAGAYGERRPSGSSGASVSSRPWNRGGASRVMRQAPRGPSDLITHLLLSHALWWEQLSPADHDLLQQLPDAASTLLSWLKRDIAEQGPRPWAAIRLALQEDAELSQAYGRIKVSEHDESETEFATLRRALDGLHLERLGHQQTELAARAAQDPSVIPQYQEVYQRWKELKLSMEHTES